MYQTNLANAIFRNQGFCFPFSSDWNKLMKIAKLIISIKLLLSCFISYGYDSFAIVGSHNIAHFQSVKQQFFSITSQLNISTFLCCDLWHCRFPLTPKFFLQSKIVHKCYHKNCIRNKCIEEHWKIRKLVMKFLLLFSPLLTVFMLHFKTRYLHFAFFHL